jgi:3'(2'), 5'-bisphosphate nucleotidase
MSRADALRTIDGDEPRAGEPHWTIDPIDGTKGFILGAQCSICLAMIDGRDTELGVLGCPRMGPRGDLGVHLHGPGVVYGAVRGGGAFEWGPDGAPAPVVRAARPGGPLRWARSLNRGANAMPSRLEPHLAAGGPLASSSMDSQCKYALVARDDADLVVRLPRSPGHRECIWDHAPGTCIAAEAGAVVTDVRGAALDFSHGEQLAANEGILCVAPEWDERVRAAVGHARSAGAGAP